MTELHSTQPNSHLKWFHKNALNILILYLRRFHRTEHVYDVAVVHPVLTPLHQRRTTNKDRTSPSLRLCQRENIWVSYKYTAMILS